MARTGDEERPIFPASNDQYLGLQISPRPFLRRNCPARENFCRASLIRGRRLMAVKALQARLLQQLGTVLPHVQHLEAPQLLSLRSFARSAAARSQTEGSSLTLVACTSLERECKEAITVSVRRPRVQAAGGVAPRSLGFPRLTYLSMVSRRFCGLSASQRAHMQGRRAKVALKQTRVTQRQKQVLRLRLQKRLQSRRVRTSQRHHQTRRRRLHSSCMKRKSAKREFAAVVQYMPLHTTLRSK